jgi:SAM-dependent methyltransferase
MNPSTLFGLLLDDGADDLVVRTTDGNVWSMPMGRWLAPASPVDERGLDRASGPVLDVGCGPGRHVHALSRRGVVAVGIELSPTAVRHAREGGARVVEGSIFEVAPNPGCWSTALLLDGNIGIGGRPAALLRRVADLLTDDGRVLVELDPPGNGAGAVASDHGPEAGAPPPESETQTMDDDPGLGASADAASASDPDEAPVPAGLRIRIESDGSTSAWFPWARVTARTIVAPAAAAGLTVVEVWSDGGRHFCALGRS